MRVLVLSRHCRRMGWAGNVARMEEGSSGCVGFYHATVAADSP